MDFYIRSLLLGVGLAMDACAVSMADGLKEPKMQVSYNSSQPSHAPLHLPPQRQADKLQSYGGLGCRLQVPGYNQLAAHFPVSWLPFRHRQAQCHGTEARSSTTSEGWTNEVSAIKSQAASTNGLFGECVPAHGQQHAPDPDSSFWTADRFSA